MVELWGNVTVGIIAGMLDEISVRHVSAAMVGAHNAMPKVKADILLRSYSRLVDLVKARDGVEAEPSLAQAHRELCRRVAQGRGWLGRGLAR